ncbi:hypothetical protein IC235_17530 [Hymenobacter sp. BT664]|uniref:Tail fiber protein n=1 Tax=Hymenobacter montanus TaxID=2771359 RepID=A0A927BGM2_9BACT|nr:hypothetical protein [Hymenobacter montanus]MBD2769694.1 hypothetical protein [Hymenobacter montanus]
MPNLILGALADAIRNSTIANIISGRKNKAVDYRTVFGTVADAVALLEGLQRGARILQGYGPPDASIGIEGDAYVNTSTSDYHIRHQFGWQFQFRLKGADGYTPQKGIDYFDGHTPRKGVDYFDGVNGKSAYQQWLDAGNVGTAAQFLASLHGADGLNGARGSVTRWESFAPSNESGNAGDTWYHAISATKYALYECLGPQLMASLPSENPQAVVVNPAAWRLRFTSPDATATTTPVTPGTGGHTIQKDGTSFSARTNLNFIGANITVTDNAATGSTEVRVGASVAKYLWQMAFGQVAAAPPQDYRVATTINLVGRSSGIASASYQVGSGAVTPFVFLANVDTRGISIPAGSSLTISNVVYQSGYTAGTLFFEETIS